MRKLQPVKYTHDSEIRHKI